MTESAQCSLKQMRSTKTIKLEIPDGPCRPRGAAPPVSCGPSQRLRRWRCRRGGARPPPHCRGRRTGPAGHGVNSLETSWCTEITVHFQRRPGAKQDYLLYSVQCTAWFYIPMKGLGSTLLCPWGPAKQTLFVSSFTGWRNYIWVTLTWTAENQCNCPYFFYFAPKVHIV